MQTMPTISTILMFQTSAIWGDNGKVGGDYYFTYGDVLFMMLNTQDTNSAEHIQFIEYSCKKC